MNRILRGVSYLSMAALMGCAAGSINNRGDASPGAAQGGKHATPSALYVKPFDISTGKWVADAPRRQREASDVQATLQQGLLERLPEIAPTRPYSGSETSGWLVTGETVHVDPGSAVLRAAVAAGAGQSKIRLRVRVFDLARSKAQPIAAFDAYADSGSGFGELGGIPVMLTNDTRRNIARVCREIRDEIKRLCQ